MAMLNARMQRPAAVQRRSAAAPRRSAVVVRAAQQLPRWPEMYQSLVSRGLKSVPPTEAAALVKAGKWVLIDVRPPPAFEKSHPEGAVNVPLYIPLQAGSDVGKLIKLVMLKSQGVDPVDPNPEFAEQVKAVAAGKQGVIFTCEAGGTMKPSVNFPAGKPSRSLQAAYRGIAESLAKTVTHLERGVYGWFQAELPFVGEYTPELGRTPMAAAEPMLQRIAQERGYEISPDDKQPVPEKKKGWF